MLFAISIKEFKIICKRIYKIILEEEALEFKYPGTNSSDGLVALKSKLGNHLKDMFIVTRNSCQDMKKVNDPVCQLEDDSSCISQLPLESFDQLLTEPKRSSCQLRGLMKLVTLQTSEFLRKLLTFFALSQSARENQVIS